MLRLHRQVTAHAFRKLPDSFDKAALVLFFGDERLGCGLEARYGPVQILILRFDEGEILFDGFDRGESVQVGLFFPKDTFGLCFLLFLVLDFLLILLQLLLGLDNTLVGGIEIFLGVDLLAEQFQSLLHFVVPFKPFPVGEELLLLLFCGSLVCFRCLQLFLQCSKVVPPGNPGNHRANTPLQPFLLLEKLFFLGFEFRQVYIAQHNSSLPADGIINRLLFLVRIIVSL